MASDKKRKKRKPAQIQTDVRIFGRGDPSNRNEGKFKVSKGVEKAADKVRARRTSKKLDTADESLRVKDQKLPTKVRIPKSKVNEPKIEKGEKRKKRGPASASAKSDGAQNAFRSTSKLLEKREKAKSGPEERELSQRAVAKGEKAAKAIGEKFFDADKVKDGLHQSRALKRPRKRKKKQDK